MGVGGDCHLSSMNRHGNNAATTFRANCRVSEQGLVTMSRESGLSQGVPWAPGPGLGLEVAPGLGLGLAPGLAPAQRLAPGPGLGLALGPEIAAEDVKAPGQGPVLGLGLGLALGPGLGLAV